MWLILVVAQCVYMYNTDGEFLGTLATVMAQVSRHLKFVHHCMVDKFNTLYIHVSCSNGVTTNTY